MAKRKRTKRNYSSNIQKVECLKDWKEQLLTIKQKIQKYEKEN